MKKIKSIASIASIASMISIASISCSDVESNLVDFSKELDTPNDTVYSLMGIIEKMQVVADRSIILGDIRSDMVSLTDNASADLQELADFTASASNAYNNARDYYAIIQNCNYYINHVDTTLTKRGISIFEKEYAAVKTFRAWTYLQLAINYGSVPFVLSPILTEKDADPALYPKKNIDEICAYFISELQPFVDTEFPSYGTVGPLNSRYFFIPVRVLLGDMCLWSGRYADAAQYYNAFLNHKDNPRPVQTSYNAAWADYEFKNCYSNYTNIFSGTSELLTAIPMAEEDYDGLRSYLSDVFTSTDDNFYYNQASYSSAYASLSKSQLYTLVHQNSATMLNDTIHPADTLEYKEDLMQGDLRLYSCVSTKSRGSSDASYNKLQTSNSKFRTSSYVRLYRLAHVYLRYAEALNRAGYPKMAFGILKYGLCQENYERLDCRGCRIFTDGDIQAAGALIAFNQYNFTRTNTTGLHSRGSGDVDCDTLYNIPELPTLSDSILFVEDKICDEMALETTFEGQRWFDLMRLAFHRGSDDFLAEKIALRSGTRDATLATRLQNRQNWYLPLE